MLMAAAALLSSAFAGPQGAVRQLQPDPGFAASFSRLCGYNPAGAEDQRLISTQYASRGASSQSVRSSSLGSIPPDVVDVGDTAVITDNGTIIQPPNNFDLKNRALLMTPDGDGYRATREDIEFIDDVGTKLAGFLSLDGVSPDSDDGYIEVQLDEAGFPFFGEIHSSLFVGTNGYITLGAPDISARVSPSILATGPPRIAPLWADLSASKKGGVFYNRVGETHVITWKKLSQPIYGGKSTFQVQLHDDGRIAFVYKKCESHASLTGISPGNRADAQPVDLSSPPSTPLAEPFFELFAEERRLDLAALTRVFYRSHQDEFDTIYIWTDFQFDNGLGVAHSFNVRNDIQGIGIPIFDRSALFGSDSRLSTMITMGTVGSWADDPHERVAGLNSAVAIVCHELGHRWLSYIQFDGARGLQDNLLGRDESHWSFLVDTRTRDEGNFSSLMEGNAWNTIAGGGFVTGQNAVNYFSPLDQYLMGLRPPDEVGDISYVVTDSSLTAFLRDKSPVAGFSISGTRKKISIQRIIDREGPRLPAADVSEKRFRVGFVLLVQPGTSPSGATLRKVENYREALVSYFSLATGRRASIDVSLGNEGQSGR
jgi:hypothetical protein